MTSMRQIHYINFSRRAATHTLFFLVPLYFLQIGFNGWQIGVITSLFAFAPLLFSFPVGWMNDRLSIKRLIQGGLLALAVLFLVIGRTKSFPVMAVIFLLIGLANNALDISTNSIYYKDESALDPNRKYAILNFWLCIGTAFGVLMGGMLTYYTNFGILFLTYAGFLFIVFVTTMNLPEGKFQFISMNEYKLDLFNRKTILFSILIFVLTLHWGVEETVFSPFLREFLHLNDCQLALYIAVPLFMLSLAAFSIGLLEHRARLNEKIFLFSMFLSGMGHIFMVHRNVYVSLLFRVVHEIGDGFMAVLVFVFISRLFKRRSIGGSSGMLIAVMTLGHVVGALVFSPIGYNVGLQYPFIISGLLLVANTGYGYYVFRSARY